MSERCPRCHALVLRDGADRLCLSCGTLTDPAARERALAVVAAEAELLASRSRRRWDRLPGESGDPSIAEMIEEYGSLPVAAWDKAAAHVDWRRRLAEIARCVAAGEFEPPPAPLAPDGPPAEAERWLAWRVEHGLPISTELLERELGLSWLEAERAMASPWHRHLRSVE